MFYYAVSKEINHALLHIYTMRCFVVIACLICRLKIHLKSIRASYYEETLCNSQDLQNLK